MSLPTINLLKSGADALMAQGTLHLQLLQVEWELEKLRYRRILYLLLIAVPLLICSLLAAGVLVMKLSWGTPFETTAACLLVATYGAGALIAMYRLHREINPDRPAFAETRREAATDIAAWRDRLNL